MNPQSVEHFTPGAIGSVMPQPKKSRSNIGATLGFIFIIIVLALGGLYFWGKYVEESQTVIYNQN